MGALTLLVQAACHSGEGVLAAACGVVASCGLTLALTLALALARARARARARALTLARTRTLSRWTAAD